MITKHQHGDYDFTGQKHIKVVNGILHVNASECLLTSDWHVPGVNQATKRRLFSYAKSHNIKHLGIIGDFWNHDAISRWELKDPLMNLNEELTQGIELLEELGQVFKIYMVCGNHDARMPRALSYSLLFSEWMSHIFKPAIVTDYDYMYLTSGGQKFRLCHPDLYSRIKGSQVSALAQDLQENVIMGHQHFLSMSTNKTGRFVCVDSGCMCDPEAFVYKRASTTRCPEWENGFIHLKEGKIRLISEHSF
jgi:predicted phosphodiesterase